MVFSILILMFYVITDIGLSKEVLFVSGAPCWFGSIITCIFIPLLVGACLYDYLNEKDK